MKKLLVIAIAAFAFTACSNSGKEGAEGTMDTTATGQEAPATEVAPATETAPATEVAPATETAPATPAEAPAPVTPAEKPAH